MASEKHRPNYQAQLRWSQKQEELSGEGTRGSLRGHSEGCGHWRARKNCLSEAAWNLLFWERSVDLFCNYAMVTVPSNTSHAIFQWFWILCVEFHLTVHAFMAHTQCLVVLDFYQSYTTWATRYLKSPSQCTTRIVGGLILKPCSPSRQSSTPQCALVVSGSSKIHALHTSLLHK